MKLLMKILFALLTLSSQAHAAQKVLVILSSENKITLREGINHPTGYFLSELMVPVMRLQAAGFIPVFANPKGNSPVMDKVSDSPMWFKTQEEYEEVKSNLFKLQGFDQPLTLKEARQNLWEFSAVFVPGGHAPMEDLLKDQDLGQILKYFHANHKPTALICHGPIALLSTLDDPEAFENALAERSSLEAQASNLRREKGVGAPGLQEIYNNIANLTEKLNELAKNFIYKDYEITAFSTVEEKQEETNGQDGVLGGFVKFYPDEALGTAGAHAVVNSIKWKSNVRVDRELITGQNPSSDEDLATALIQLLNKK